MLSVAFKYPMISKVLLSEAQSALGITQKYFKHSKNVFLSGLIVRTILTKCTRNSPDGLIQPTNFLKPRSLSQGLTMRHKQISKFDINTNIQNNVLLYKKENLRNHRTVPLFVLGNFIGWSILAIYIYQPSLLDIFTTNIETKQYWKDNMWRLLTFIFSITIGPSLFFIFYALNARTVKYIILNKGGKTLTLVTHHLLKSKASNNLSIHSVKCVSHRTDFGTYVPLKIENRRFYFLVEKNGTFVNPELFDYVLA